MADVTLQARDGWIVSAEAALDRDTALAFALRVRRQRERAGLTQEIVAERVGISRNHYQLLESGLSDRAKSTPANPRLSTLLALAAALDCTPAELMPMD